MATSMIRIPKRKITDFYQRYNVQRLALFGSVLRGDFRPDSDIDVLILFDPTARITFLTLGRMKRELSEIFHRPVDPVPQDGLKPTIREIVLSSAQEVYAA
jgi:hypothetical protein